METFINETKTHQDCDWCLEIITGAYQCCDCRSQLFGRKLNSKEILGGACILFHQKKPGKSKIMKPELENSQNEQPELNLGY